MNIEASCKMNYETYKKFYYFTLVRKKISLIFFLILAVSVVIGIPLSITLFVLTHEISNLLFVALFIFLTVFVIFRFTYAPKKNYRSNMKLYEQISNYVFGEDDIKITSKTESNSISGTSNINYDNITKVYNTKEYIYIFITKNRAFAIPKSSFTVGTADDLCKFLSEKIGPQKFISCKK